MSSLLERSNQSRAGSGSIDASRRRVSRSGGSATRRIPALDGCRGICAVVVATYHFPHRAGPFDTPIFNAGWVYVDFFFVLSGFVISRRYFQPGAAFGYAVFAAARIRRLYPAHMLAMGAALAAALLSSIVRYCLTGAVRVDGMGRDAYDFLRMTAAQFLLLQGFAPFNRAGFVVPSWSVSVEFWVNLSFGMLVRLRLYGFRPLASLSVLLLLALACQNPRDYLDGGALTNLSRCACGFALGACICSIVAKQPRLHLSDFSFTAAEIACVCLAALSAVIGERLELLWTLPILFSGCVFVFAHERGVISRLLTCSFCQSLGRRSYAIYLVHATWVSLFYSVRTAATRQNLLSPGCDGLIFWVEFPIYWIAVWFSAKALERGADLLTDSSHWASRRQAKPTL